MKLEGFAHTDDDNTLIVIVAYYNGPRAKSPACYLLGTLDQGSQYPDAETALAAANLCAAEFNKRLAQEVACPPSENQSPSPSE